MSGMVPTPRISELSVPGMAEFREQTSKPVNRQQHSLAQWGARMLKSRKS